MLETEIKKLREALEANTAAILGQAKTSDVKSEDKTEPEKEPEANIKENPEDRQDPENPDEPETKAEETSDEAEFTTDSLKAFAREVIAAGVGRQDVKALVSKCGGEMIGDLDEAGLKKLHAALVKAKDKADG